MLTHPTKALLFSDTQLDSKAGKRRPLKGSIGVGSKGIGLVGLCYHLYKRTPHTKTTCSIPKPSLYMQIFQTFTFTHSIVSCNEG